MDKAIIQQQAKEAARGSRGSFGFLYDTYIDEVYRFVYYKVHHQQQAEDITADVFTKAYEKISSFDPNKASFRTWIYMIARTTIIDHYRTSKSASSIEDAWDVASDTDLGKEVGDKLDVSYLQPYLSQLSAGQREILMLRLWQDMSYKEIAEILGKSEASCKMAFSRSLKKLKDIMPISLLISFLITKIVI